MEFWSNGIAIRHRSRKRWHVRVNYQHPEPDTRETMMLRGSVGVHSASTGDMAADLSGAIQAALQHAEYLGVHWRDPAVYLAYIDRQDDRAIAQAEAERLGWPLKDIPCETYEIRQPGTGRLSGLLGPLLGDHEGEPEAQDS